MFQNYIKQNVNYVETLFTKFRIINPNYQQEMDELLANAEAIAHINVVQTAKAAAGMSKEKLKALTHPYPSIIDKIEKFGYDPKQLHHILRLNDFLQKYSTGASFLSCLVPNEIELLKRVKKGVIPLAAAESLTIKVDEDTYNLSKSIEQATPNENNVDTIKLLHKIQTEVLKKNFKRELLEPEI